MILELIQKGPKNQAKRLVRIWLDCGISNTCYDSNGIFCSCGKIRWYEVE